MRCVPSKECDAASGLPRQNISIAAGLFAAFNDRNMVYERLFDNVINLSDGQTSSFSNVVVNPLTFAPADVSGPRTNTIVRAEQTIANWPEPERNRAYLRCVGLNRLFVKVVLMLI